MSGDPGMNWAVRNGQTGQSAFGQNYTPSQAFAHTLGRMGPLISTPTAPTNLPPYSVNSPAPAGGSSSGGSVLAPGGEPPLWLVIWLYPLMLIGIIYGVQDSIRHRASSLHSAAVSYSYTYEVSEYIGHCIRMLGPQSTVVSVVDGARWTVGIIFSLDIAIGAVVGGEAVQVTRWLTSR
jgi:hypothetical protein